MRGTRRQLLTASSIGLAASTLGLAACGGGSGASGDGSADLQFTWWGNDVRNKNTTNAITAYTKANPSVKIAAQPGEWTSYWDKLATQVAGNTAPDIIQMDMAYISEYGNRGALLDLGQYGADTSKFAPGTADSGKINNTLYGINAGINTPVIMISPKAFQSAGVSVPDDKTWTWDSLKATAAEITTKTGGKITGLSSFFGTDALLSAFLRQHNKELFTDKGLGFDTADVVAWFDLMVSYAEAKAIPPASQIQEDSTKSLDQNDLATGKTAMSMFWSNQVEALNAASGQTLTIARYPSLTGKAVDRKAWYKASMLWSASSRTKSPETVTAFLNWMANSTEAGNIGLAERGMPPNTDVLAAIKPKLSTTQQAVAKFIGDISGELATTPIAPPPGGGTLAAVLLRHGMDVLFKRASVQDAAQKFVDEVKSNLTS